MTVLADICGYQVDLLVQGFPGKSLENGGLGWSAVVLLRGRGRVILVDTGSFSVRKTLLARLAERGIARHDVTDILLTHAHYDHMMNWTLFPAASVAICGAELDHALAEPIETSLCAELYVRALAESPQLRRLTPGAEALPGIAAIAAPGHTPHHLSFVLDDGAGRVILAADAVKNRAELLAAAGDSTQDGAASSATIANIADLWRARSGAIIVCGHDLPLLNDGDGGTYLGTRRAGILCWFGASLDDSRRIALSTNGDSP
ncbi:MBL fold metallo-hydrolase (plasmid) [Paracoccus liaowanqingii]|uniref:MBL fold metallo-hydrolase n=1 Tax=Paracoccus liaowanqingii TaxID=2560053 RepID=A0A4Y5SVE2_9RHOB|nr:MBL fold metallo-hydrolase [Paracoccus liaowanqingii]QDA36943.1 MBL fold metallo-hydrolase [Paracoccus liaowanqingii]